MEWGADPPQGDPGAYDPYTLKELASTSKKSFARSMRQGQGDFGGKDKRELAVEIMGESTPGPGAYNGGEMMRTGKKAALSAFDTGERMPMSSFKSKSAQRETAENQNVPGAGAYTPNWKAIEKEPMNPAMQMKGKGKRLESVTQVTDPIVGPGCTVAGGRSGDNVKGRLEGLARQPRLAPNLAHDLLSTRSRT